MSIVTLGRARRLCGDVARAQWRGAEVDGMKVNVAERERKLS